MSEDRMTREEFYANRKAAGRLIDVETCRVWSEHSDIANPYELPREFFLDVDEKVFGCIGKVTFVGSAESLGPVCDQDLPEDKWRALLARLELEKQVPTTAEGVRDVLLEEYARAAAELDEVIDHLVDRRFPNVQLEVVRCGARLALAELGKQGSPQEARLERLFRAKMSRRGE